MIDARAGSAMPVRFTDTEHGIRSRGEWCIPAGRTGLGGVAIRIDKRISQSCGLRRR